MLDFKNKLIPHLLEESASRYPKRTALMVHRGNGDLREISYEKLLENVRKLASFIQRSGFRAGDHIALLGSNSPEWATAYFSILSAECVVIPLDSTQRLKEIRHIVRHSEAKGIFYDSRFACPLHEENGLNYLKEYLLDDILKYIEGEKNPLPPRYPDTDESPAAIIYTSGTTGSAKGVVLTHRNIVSDVVGIAKSVEILPADNFISVLPLHHCFEGTGGFLAPISIGCGICYARTLRAKEILEDIQASGATVILGVPLLFDKIHKGIVRGVGKKGFLVKAAFGSAIGLTKVLDGTISMRSGKALMKTFRKKAGFGNLRMMVSGGAAIKSDVIEFFNRFGVICIQGYGLSETSPVLTLNHVDTKKFGSVGPAIEGVRLKIDSPNSESIGEILAKGLPVFNGYYKNPDATNEAFNSEGWFRTGDLGRLDKDGFLYIVGRIKDVIVTSAGKNIYPEELEEKIDASRFVMESLVIGVTRGDNEEPFAIVVPDYEGLDSHFDGKWTDKDVERIFRELIESVNMQIAPYKRIKGFKVQQEEFQKTSTKKIKRYLYDIDEIRVADPAN